jgi:hypothetical protein
MRPVAVSTRFAHVVAVGLACLALGACSTAPAGPHGSSLPAGRWTGEPGSCLSVGSAVCDLVVGCGHGQFPPPVLRADGTFEVAGTYRIEAGPVGITPAPPATFSGFLTGDTLTLTVTPSDPSLGHPSAVLRLTGGTGQCVVPCL